MEIRKISNGIEEEYFEKGGVDLIFAQNPELASIGTKEQYEKYINSIFPESIVKDILWHGGNLEEGIVAEKGIYFTDSNQYARQFMALNETATGFYPGVMDIRNPLEINFVNYQIVEIINHVKKDLEIDLTKYKDTILDLAKQVKESPELQQQIKESDAIVGQDLYDDTNQLNKFSYGDSPELFYKLKQLAESCKVYVVFEKEQLHILANKDDLNGFREFIETENKTS